MFRKSSNFIRDIKEGKVRGDYMSELVEDGVHIEISVGSFQYGKIVVRLWVEDPEISRKEGLNFRQLHRLEEKYSRIHKSVQNMLRQENETDVPVLFEPEVQIPDPAVNEPDFVPEGLAPDDTVSFQQSIRIRDDVSSAEALLTNREDGMTRSEIRELRDD